MDQVHGDSPHTMKSTAVAQPARAKVLSLTGVAGLYVCSLLLGGLTLFGYFVLPRTGMSLLALTACSVVVAGAAFYSIWLAVEFFRAHRS